MKLTSGQFEGHEPSNSDIERAWFTKRITNEEAADLSSSFLSSSRNRLTPESDFDVNQIHKKAGIADIDGHDVIQERRGRSYKAEKAAVKRRKAKSK